MVYRKVDHYVIHDLFLRYVDSSVLQVFFVLGRIETKSQMQRQSLLRVSQSLVVAHDS